jgi:hypothetical protein
MVGDLVHDFLGIQISTPQWLGNEVSNFLKELVAGGDL